MTYHLLVVLLDYILHCMAPMSYGWRAP